jgi:hypothetical protein
MGAPLRKLSGDPECKNGTFPTLWVTADRTGYVVQGQVITDADQLAQLDLPAGETAVAVPAAVLEEYFRAHR